MTAWIVYSVAMYKFELTDSVYELRAPLVDIEPVVLANAYEAFPDLDEADLGTQLRVERRFLDDLRISDTNVTELIIANNNQVLCATFAQGCGGLYDALSQGSYDIESEDMWLAANACRQRQAVANLIDRIAELCIASGDLSETTRSRNKKELLCEIIRQDSLPTYYRRDLYVRANTTIQGNAFTELDPDDFLFVQKHTA